LHKYISWEPGTGALVQFPMIFQQAATCSSALCISLSLSLCLQGAYSIQQCGNALFLNELLHFDS